MRNGDLQCQEAEQPIMMHGGRRESHKNYEFKLIQSDVAIIN